jgi:hypothetical protein
MSGVITDRPNESTFSVYLAPDFMTISARLAVRHTKLATPSRATTPGTLTLRTNSPSIFLSGTVYTVEESPMVITA